MKCNGCGSEWQVFEDVQIMFCPFCGVPINELDCSFDNLETALACLVDVYGENILKNKKNTMQFLKYYLPKCEREYNFLNLVYASGFMEPIFRIRNLPKVAQKGALKQIDVQLCDKYGVSSSWAQYIVGCICKSLGMPNDLDNSIIKLKQKAEDGDSAAQFKLAKAYLLGSNVEKNKEKHLFWLKKAGELDYPPALYQLGVYLFDGVQCPKNEEKALQYIVKAASLRNVDAVCYLGRREQLKDQCGLDVDKIIFDISLSCDSLSASQLISLGLYFKQIGNIKEAKRFAELAYKKDSKATWSDYYNILLSFPSFEAKTLALKVLREVATDGNIDACKMLGTQYENGAKEEKDMLIAIYWFRVAAESGGIASQIHIAEIYEHGIHVPVDIEKAVYWYRVAAYNGSRLSKKKVNYTDKECLLTTITLLLNDGTEIECDVDKSVSYRNQDYLIVSDPTSKEKIVLLYREVCTLEGFEVEGVDEKTEYEVLKAKDNYRNSYE